MAKKTTPATRTGILVGVALVVILFGLCIVGFWIIGSNDPGDISRADYEKTGKTWPYIVDEGTLTCIKGNQVYFTAPDDTMYTVNGAAMGAQPVLPDDQIIKADNPDWDGPGTIKLDSGDAIKDGLALCASK